jgi:hypothetical protein
MNNLDNGTREFLNSIFNINDVYHETFIYLFSNATHPDVSKSLNKLSKRNFVNKLKISKYFRCKQKFQCIICLDNVKKTEYIRKLECNHEYHKKCIDNWMYSLYKNGDVINCPLCRKTVIYNNVFIGDVV